MRETRARIAAHNAAPPPPIDPELGEDIRVEQRRLVERLFGADAT